MRFIEGTTGQQGYASLPPTLGLAKDDPDNEKACELNKDLCP